MSEPQIPGMRRKPIQVTQPDGEFQLKWFIVVNLADLTDAVVNGERVGGGATKASWTDDDLGALTYGPTMWEALSDDQKDSNITKLLDYLKQFDQNNDPIKHAREDSGFKSRYTTPEGKERRTLLWFPEEVTRAAPMLSLSYGQLAAERTYRAHYPDTNFEVALSSFRLAWIKPVVEANAKLAHQLAPLREGVERLELLHQVVSAMLDFAAPPAKRKRLWRITKPYVTSPLAYQEGFAYKPNPTELSNARSLRDVTIPGLTQAAAAALEWRMSGVARPGHPGTADLVLAQDRNTEAMKLLEALRTNEIIQLLLGEHENVLPTVWNLLEEILVEAFAQLATAPPALEQLLESEFMCLARLAVQGDFDMSKTKANGPASKALLKEIETFVPETELAEKATALTKLFGQMRDGVDAFRAPSATYYRLWTMAAPRLMPVIKSVAKRRVYMLRASFQTAYAQNPLSPQTQQYFSKMQDYFDVIDNENPEMLKHFLDDLLARTKRTRLVGAAAWSGFSFIASAASLGLAFRYLTRADVTDRTSSDALALTTSLLATTKGAADFVGSVSEAAPYFQGRIRNAHETYSRLTTVGGKAGASLSMLDPVISVFLFAGAALAYGEANVAYRKAKRRKSDTADEDRDVSEKREQAILALVGVGLGMASLALMMPLPVAGAVLALGGLALDRETWKSLSGLSSLPGPGKIAKDTYDFLTEEKFRDAIQYAPTHAEISTRVESLRGFVSETFEEGTGTFWAMGAALLSSTHRDILRSQYGFPSTLIDKLVEAG